jgi:hypothetical protein
MREKLQVAQQGLLEVKESFNATLNQINFDRAQSKSEVNDAVRTESGKIQQDFAARAKQRTDHCPPEIGAATRSSTPRRLGGGTDGATELLGRQFNTNVQPAVFGAESSATVPKAPR